MRRILLSIVLLFAVAANAALTPTDFARMRQTMREQIVLGADDADTSHPVVAEYIATCSRLGDSLWHTMRRDTAFLWDDLTLLTGVPAYTPYHVHRSYIRLHLMARAWAYPSSPLYRNAALLADIRYGLDWLARRAYNNTLPHIGN